MSCQSVVQLGDETPRTAIARENLQPAEGVQRCDRQQHQTWLSCNHSQVSFGRSVGVTTGQPRTWTFLTNHARVLISIAETPGIRLRDIADRIGITERAAQRIVAELESAGYLSHEKKGRRNLYQLRPNAHLRHPLEQDIEIGQLLDFFVGRTSTKGTIQAS